MKNISECDGGCVGGDLSSTLGVGNAVPAQIAAMSAADQSSPLAKGSGDLFSTINPAKNDKPKKKRKKYVLAKKKHSKFYKLSESDSFDDINRQMIDINDSTCKIYAIEIDE